MQRAIPFALLLLAACGQVERRGGIVSTNPCADAVLVELVPRRRIAAISHYSRHPGASSMPLALARSLPWTAGTAEEVIALHPDVVLTSSFTPAATRAAYARAGLRVMLLGLPTSIAESEAQVLQIADAVGASAKGRAMVARIEAAVAHASPCATCSPAQAGVQSQAAQRSRPWTPAFAGEQGSGGKPATLLFIADTLATGPGTLLDDMMTHAGLTNAAPGYGVTHTGGITAEAIAARPPQLLLEAGTGRSATLRGNILQRLGAPTKRARFARNLINCGGPTIIPAMARLAGIRRSLAS